jgi:hypothetical protein
MALMFCATFNAAAEKDQNDFFAATFTVQN